MRFRCTRHLGRGGVAAPIQPLRPVSRLSTMLRARLYKPVAAKWLGIGGLVLLGFGVAGCAALIVGSVVASVDLAAYEYVNAGAPTPPAQPGAQPKLSLNDIE
jgi:hypothetical protein